MLYLSFGIGEMKPCTVKGSFINRFILFELMWHVGKCVVKLCTENSLRAAFLLISSFLFSFKKDKDFWWTASSSFTLLFFFLLFYTQKEGGEPQGAQGAGNRAEGWGFLLLESALGLALIPRCFVVHRCFGLLDLFRIRSRGFWVLRFV
jgi:hypothetical protein